MTTTTTNHKSATKAIVTSGGAASTSTTAATSVLSFLDGQIQTLNNSKFFAGMVIIMLNIGSRFINFKFNKSTEKFLRLTLSKHLFIFAVVWMGTRDIYLSLIYSSIFIFLIDVLLNDESDYCIIPTHYRHMFDLEDEEEFTNRTVTEEEYQRSKDLIEKYNHQKETDTKKKAYENFAAQHRATNVKAAW